MTDAPFEHVPVLVSRVVELFQPVPAGTIIDATLGGGGHAAALLDARPDIRVLGIDRDRDALAAAEVRLGPYGARAIAQQARFDHLAAVVASGGAVIQPIVGVLFDLGVSSAQFDRAERGFSYRLDAPLDMRMDTTSGPSATDIVNTWDVGELSRILRVHADERYAARIARAVVLARPIATTTELAGIVAGAIPAPARRRGGHPAKRTFQALRIEVNAELDQLPVALDAALLALAPGGRCVAISYHSGEDRLVKSRFRRADNGGCTCPPNLPCVCGAQPEARLLKRGGWVPSAEEIATNPRAASARMRAVEKIPLSGSDCDE